MAKTLTLKDTVFYRSAPNVEAIPCSLFGVLFDKCINWAEAVDEDIPNSRKDQNAELLFCRRKVLLNRFAWLWF